MGHYEQHYFDWQKSIGAFGGSANLFKFETHIEETDKVIDFGSGGGYLLANIKANDKIGVEINDSAREEASKMGIKTFSSFDLIEDNWADIIISNHALEHVHNPLMELKQLKNKLKVNGKIVFVVPYERDNVFVANDINFHLFTWSEMNLGNLFTLAGFKVDSVTEIKHRWPRKFTKIRKRYGEKMFHKICRINGALNREVSQVKIVAHKES